MAKIIRCDNTECGKEIADMQSYVTVEVVTPAVTFSDYMGEKQFCSLGCVAIYAAGQSGWKVDDA